MALEYPNSSTSLYPFSYEDKTKQKVYLPFSRDAKYVQQQELAFCLLLFWLYSYKNFLQEKMYSVRITDG